MKKMKKLDLDDIIRKKPETNSWYFPSETHGMYSCLVVLFFALYSCELHLCFLLIISIGQDDDN
jgi:hypothetical protein